VLLCVLLCVYTVCVCARALSFSFFLSLSLPPTPVPHHSSDLRHTTSCSPAAQWSEAEDEYGELLIDSNFFVTGVGTVVAGTVTAGIIHVGQKMLMGPDGNGNFRPVQIKSIHKRRQPVKSVAPGDSAGLCLKKVKRSLIRKGMVLVHPDAHPTASWAFKARIRVLYHSTTIQVKYQPVIQCLTMR
jgi:GTP-binding protein 1